MKISGARAEPFAAIRRQNLAEAGASAVTETPSVDQIQFLGITETELSPAVRGAIAMLVIELEDLRTEVRRLKARLLEAEAEADEDPLTRVKNRRAFVRELTKIVAFVQRYESPASLIYVDLDDLKAINDRFGHAAWRDAALTKVAEILSVHVREFDVVGRMGGDEFGIVLAQADLEAATAKAESLAALIAAEPIDGGDWLVPIRVSWGVRLIDPTLDPELLIAGADAAMLTMKRARG